jgi:hypothetical protein
MNNRQMFKAGFLAKCVEDGLTLPEIKQRVKQAIHVKKADGLLESLAQAPVAGLLGAGALGTALGHMVIGPSVYETFKERKSTPEELMHQELVGEYDRQARIIQQNTDLARRKKLRDNGIRGITRY